MTVEEIKRVKIADAKQSLDKLTEKEEKLKSSLEYCKDREASLQKESRRINAEISRLDSLCTDEDEDNTLYVSRWLNVSEEEYEEVREDLDRVREEIKNLEDELSHIQLCKEIHQGDIEYWEGEE